MLASGSNRESLKDTAVVGLRIPLMFSAVETKMPEGKNKGQAEGASGIIG